MEFKLEPIAVTPSQREDLKKLQAETLKEKHLRLMREKQAACPHNNIEDFEGFVWCADCGADLF